MNLTLTSNERSQIVYALLELSSRRYEQALDQATADALSELRQEAQELRKLAERIRKES